MKNDVPVAPALAVPKHEDRPVLAIFFALAGAATLATVAALTKIAHSAGVTLVEAMFFRQLFSLPIVLLCVQAGAGFASMRTGHFRLHFLRMLLGPSGKLLYFGAVMLLPLAEAMTIGFTAPIFATILSALVLREPTGWHRWFAVAAGFAGVLLVFLPGLDANNLGWFGSMMGLPPLSSPAASRSCFAAWPGPRIRRAPSRGSPCSRLSRSPA